MGQSAVDGRVFQSFRPMVFRELAAAVEQPTSVSQGCDGRFVDWKWLNIYRLGNNMLEYIMLFHCTWLYCNLFLKDIYVCMYITYTYCYLVLCCIYIVFIYVVCMCVCMCVCISKATWP